MRRSVELALLLAGVFLLGSAGWKAFRYEAFQSHPDWFFRVSRQASSFLPDRLAALYSDAPHARILGRLEVPRIQMSVVIVDGDDEGSLDLGAGHVPGTAAVGATGNSVIAGHRDTTFRALRRIKLGDQIRIESDHVYVYSVDSVQIVDPDDVQVLQTTASPTLTLVTCYPFRFIGDAPKRYVIQARRLPI